MCLVLTGLSQLCVRDAIGQTTTWDLNADWNGQNPINAYWSMSGGPTAHNLDLIVAELARFERR